jgi:hypothetical protein
MDSSSIVFTGDFEFKLRFNTTHGETNLYWRLIIENREYLVNAIHCNVPTYSESSFDEKAQAIKFHMAGKGKTLHIDNKQSATIS